MSTWVEAVQCGFTGRNCPGGGKAVFRQGPMLSMTLRWPAGPTRAWIPLARRGANGVNLVVAGGTVWDFTVYLLASTYGDCACRIHFNIRSSDIGTWSEDGNAGCNPRYRSRNLKTAAKYSQGPAALKPRGSCIAAHQRSTARSLERSPGSKPRDCCAVSLDERRRSQLMHRCF